MDESAEIRPRRLLGFKFKLFEEAPRPGGLDTWRDRAVLPMPRFPYVWPEAKLRTIVFQPVEKPTCPPLLLFVWLITVRNFRPLRAILLEIDGDPPLVIAVPGSGDTIRELEDIQHLGHGLRRVRALSDLGARFSCLVVVVLEIAKPQ